jgi:hypothetical protein
MKRGGELMKKSTKVLGMAAAAAGLAAPALRAEDVTVKAAVPFDPGRAGDA